MKNYMPQLETFEKKGLEFLRLLQTKAMDADVPTELTQSLGDPGQIICHIADTWGADLIVIGRRCRTGLNELILGSASNYVLHHASCSVLISQRCK
jgi:nucleotide-binding universal stress UspA family protein